MVEKKNAPRAPTPSSPTSASASAVCLTELLRNEPVVAVPFGFVRGMIRRRGGERELVIFERIPMPTIDVEQQRRDARRAYLNFLSLKRSSRQRGDRGNLAVASSAVGWRQWRARVR